MTKLIMFSGELGSYKTSSAVALAIRSSLKSSRDLKVKIPIISNMPIKDFENYEPLEGPNDWAKLYQYSRFGSVLYLDELQSLLDSRQSQTRANIRFTQAMYYFRKLKTVFVSTTPDWTSVDIRVRNILTYHIHLSRHKQKIIFDIYNPISDRFIGSKIKPIDTIEPYHKYFDTNSIIFPVQVPDTLENLIGIKKIS